jgi:transcriptional regulator with XRE-family HTH domain
MTQDSLGRNLRMLRADRGITLAEAEELTGVTQETLSALERGQRGAYTSTLRKIADAYDITLGPGDSGTPRGPRTLPSRAPRPGRRGRGP